MTKVVADTSALVSLAIAADTDPDPLSLALEAYTVLVPSVVSDELEEIASHADEHARAASTVLDRTAELRVQSVELDAEFPLDDGEHAAVMLANDVNAALLFCDEFNSLGLVHASLADTQLVTTPTLLAVFVRNGRLSADAAVTLLDEISAARSWDANSYVTRARSMLDQP